MNSIGSDYSSKFEEVRKAGATQTAVMHFSGMKDSFRKVADVPFLGGWSFTPGINGTTFQFKCLPYEPLKPVIRSTIDDEFIDPNGEGVDCFSRHGTFKEQLHLSLYLSMSDCPVWVQNDPFIEKKDGMVLLIVASFSDPGNRADKVIFLKSPVIQSNTPNFNEGESNRFDNNFNNIKVDLSFEGETE